MTSQRVVPDLQRIVLDPAGPRVDLRVLFLCARHDLASPIEDDEAGAGRALVERSGT